MGAIIVVVVLLVVAGIVVKGLSLLFYVGSGGYETDRRFKSIL